MDRKKKTPTTAPIRWLIKKRASSSFFFLISTADTRMTDRDATTLAIVDAAPANLRTQQLAAIALSAVSGGSQAPRQRNALEDSAKCVICYDFARPPAMCCSNGCVYCRSCLMRALKLTTPVPPEATARPLTALCQTCRVERVFSACPAIDRMVRDQPATCRNVCGTQGLTVTTVEAHEAECLGRSVDCRYRAHGCMWVGRASEGEAHETTCRGKIFAAHAREMRKIRAEWEDSMARINESASVVLSAVRGALPKSLLTKPFVVLSFAALTAKPAFEVRGRRYSLRAEELCPADGPATLRRSYGACMANERGSSVPGAGGGGTAPSMRPQVLWVRFQVLLIQDTSVIGIGTVIGTFSDARQTALPVSFVVPVIQPPPWTVRVIVMASSIVEPQSGTLDAMLV